MGFLKALFSFAGMGAVPSMRREMINRGDLTGAIVKAMTLVTVIYVVVCIPCLLSYGTPDEHLLDFVKPFFSYTGSAGIIVHVFIALPLVLNVVFNTLSLTILPVMKTKSLLSIMSRF